MITPVSAQEYNSHLEGKIPDGEEVSDGIWTLPLTNKPGHMPFTYAYLIQDAHFDIHLVDSGWDLDENLDIIDAAMCRLGASYGLASIIVTHLHPDHMGLAQRMRERYGTRVLMSRIEQQAQAEYANLGEHRIRVDLANWGVPAEWAEQVLKYAIATPRVTTPVDDVIDDGQLLDIPGRQLRAIHSPGHTPGHLCLHEEDAQLVFSGDQLLPKVTPGVGAALDAAHNALEQYLCSLERLCSFDANQCLPGHEYRYYGIAARAQTIATRHLTRTAEVEKILARDPEANAWQVGSCLSWGRGWEALDRHYLISALRQTSMHIELVRTGKHLAAFEAWSFR